MYHNTTDSDGPELHRFRICTMAQDKAILEYFTLFCADARRVGYGHADCLLCVAYLKLFDVGMTPSVLHHVMQRDGCLKASVPLTSVRRALSNLTKSGKMIKTTKQTTGPLGRPEYVYTLPMGQLTLV